jgi:hypothetical protein
MNTTLDIKEITTIAAGLLREKAIAELDRQLDLYRDAQRIYEASIGSMSEQVSIEQGLRVNADYQATIRAYAALGLTNLGIHRI